MSVIQNIQSYEQGGSQTVQIADILQYLFPFDLFCRSLQHKDHQPTFFITDLPACPTSQEGSNVPIVITSTSAFASNFRKIRHYLYQQFRDPPSSLPNQHKIDKLDQSPRPLPPSPQVTKHGHAPSRCQI